jgi:hypothetical protein
MDVVAGMVPSLDDPQLGGRKCGTDPAPDALEVERIDLVRSETRNPALDNRSQTPFRGESS